MARPLRIQFPGAIYHVIARGNARQPIYLADADFRLWLRLLWRVADRLDWTIRAYCLMPNHYHLLMQTRTATLSRGMRDLNGAYAEAFNARHKRVGHLLQGRYKSILLQDAARAVTLSRYIALNPVEAGLAATPDGWPWSSYAATIGLVRRPRRLDATAVLAAFASGGDDGREAYARFVHEGTGRAASALSGRVPTIAGDDMFVASVLEPRQPVSAEVPRVERAHPPLAVFSARSSRDEAIRAAWASGLYPQTEIARHFRLHYTTVNRIIGNSGCQDAKNKDLTPSVDLAP